MRRAIFLLLGLLLAACAETVVSDEDLALGDDIPTTLETTTTSTPAVEVVSSGREALAANSGKAHVLWFWGAH